MITHTVKIAEQRLSDGSTDYDVLIVGPLEGGKRTVMEFRARNKTAAYDMAEAMTKVINDSSIEIARFE